MNKSALHKISYGIYVITSSMDDKINGQICNSVFQVTSEPPQVAICINKQNYTHEFLQASKKFAVNILAEDVDMVFIGRFGFRCGRDFDKFDSVKYHLSDNGNPILDENSVAWLECDVTMEVDVGSHTMFIGPLKDADILSDAEPLTYDNYHRVKKGKAPRSLPSRLPRAGGAPTVGGVGQHPSRGVVVTSWILRGSQVGV